MATPPRVARALAIGATGLAIAGCSSGSSGQSPATTTAPASRAANSSSAGAAYLADVGPADAALGAFTAKSRAWTASTPIAQAVSDAAPAVTALETFDAALRDQSWPPSAARWVCRRCSARTPLSCEISRGSRPWAVWTRRPGCRSSRRDLGVDSSAAASVRRELGLPPAESDRLTYRYQPARPFEAARASRAASRPASRLAMAWRLS